MSMTGLRCAASAAVLVITPCPLPPCCSVQLEGALIPLLESLVKYHKVRRVLEVDCHPRPDIFILGSNASPAVARVWVLGRLLMKLDTYPGSAGLQFQEKLVPALCAALHGLTVSHACHDGSRKGGGVCEGVLLGPQRLGL